MQATVPGMNRTGAAVSPEGTQAMTRAANELTPPMQIDTAASEAQRIVYINESAAVGSIPPPASLKGVVKTGVARLKGSNPSIFLDKMGERIAYERSGTRLYDALITKYQATSMMEGGMLPTVEELAARGAAAPAVISPIAGEDAAGTLERIRAEELQHFRMLCDAMQKLGGDPTAQTPCADVIGTASMGFLQVLTDPRTTLAQCLNTMLAVELTDNAAWELLIQLADDAGETELSGRFLAALSQEQQHLAIVKEWVCTLVATGAGTPAV
jgi:rubrerythrin